MPDTTTSVRTTPLTSRAATTPPGEAGIAPTRPQQVRPARLKILAVLAAALSVGVCVIHVMDQGGLPGDKTPGYVGLGYWVLEAVALVAAVALLVRPNRVRGFALALAVGVGPMVGYCLSRGPGLPSYADDRGNWTEPLGIIGLVVEGALVLVTFVAVSTLRQSGSSHRS